MVEVRWTGCYPNLCSGEWVVKIDGVRVDDPPFQYEPADTEGMHQSWHFDCDWDECWECYRDGLDYTEWCECYKEWLNKVNPEGDLWVELYEAFQSEDWRYGECGGCI